MEEHKITLWVKGDLYDEIEDDFQNVLHDNGLILESSDIKTFPWNDIQHEIIWWITRRMTMEEWLKLDDLETEIISELVGDDFIGTAGPIPFDD